jgi:SRSO17 transposase
MMDSRLYLPEAWCDDSSRCEVAGIPEESRVFKKKKENKQILGMDQYQTRKRPVWHHQIALNFCAERKVTLL